MKIKHLKFMILITILLTSTIGLNIAFAAKPDPTSFDPMDIVAGQDTKVGEIEVSQEPGFIVIKYVLEGGALMTESHIHVADDVNDIPQKNGNPIPGQFDYKEDHDPAVAEYEYRIPNTWAVDTTLYIAAHAVVKTVEGYEEVDLVAFCATLPEDGEMTVIVPDPSNIGYFRIILDDEDDILDGAYPGWCVDTDYYINTGGGNYPWYYVDIYCSYEDLPEGVIEFEENLDLLNYLINQDYVGQGYTIGEVQKAIWEIMANPEYVHDSLDPWDQEKVDEIVAEVEANGEGYVPDCGDKLVLILEATGKVPPADEDEDVLFPAQTVIIYVDIPCEPIYGEETAWAANLPFPGNNWAMYFDYTVVSDPPAIVPAVLSKTPGNQGNGKGWGPPDKSNREKGTWGKQVSEQRGKPKRS